MNNKNIIGMIFGAAAFLIVYLAVQQVFFKPISFENQIREMANELNKSCPIMVDSETQLNNAMVLNDNTFEYNYTLVNMGRAELDIEALESYLQPIILNNIKTSPDLKIFRDNEITMAYNYKDKNGEQLFRIVFEAENYK